MINLNNVTLFCMDCVNPVHAINAMKYSMRKINFKRALLASDTRPNNLPNNIEWVRIPKINNWMESSLMTFYWINGFIQTDFVLGIQSDGFVINPHLWEDEFLKYDYIGAPWPQLDWKNRVGNGGFCLESKKYLETVQYLEWDGKTGNDLFICKNNYDWMVDKGIKFAPVEVAARFSMENPLWDIPYDLSKCFGFHRSWPRASQIYTNMIRQDSPIWEKQ